MSFFVYISSLAAWDLDSKPQPAKGIMGTFRIVSMLAVIAFLGILSNVDGHRVLRSGKPGAHLRSLSKSTLEGRDPPVGKVPKYSSREEAQRVSVARWRNAEALATAPRSDNATVLSGGRLFYVTDYGADPTGATDSTQALSEAINEAFQVTTTKHTMPGLQDLGGVEIHLEGGNYRISEPLRLPESGGGNVVIHGGTLRASENFPEDRYLIELWTSTDSLLNGSLNGDELAAATKDADFYAASYEYITLRDLMLDANFRGGGILVINSLRTNIDSCYISHFTSFGIMVQGGHETYIRNSFLGQHITAGSSPLERNFSGVGISLMGNDNAITDVVIFSAAVGISVSGQANIITGVHCYNKATAFGGIGIRLLLGGLTQTRILGAYMDYTGIVAEDPVQLDIANGFFLGDANIVLKSSQRKMISGVNIVNNMFTGSGKGVEIVQLEGQFDSIDQTIVDRNNVLGMTLKSTVARGTVQGNGSTWAIDFNPVLLFPNLIQHVQYSFYTSDASFPRHALRNVSENKVVIEADTEVSATVSVQVDQSASFVHGSKIYS